ncbi:unnamed protein product [Nezara viridula]|uniref:Uncharacterized protein n=1 Tax=Nezara viridula TaxID=85310 RepID=A0A9P0MU26_NEZVI|nr:unnamed protein product [Nezara viridula]
MPTLSTMQRCCPSMKYVCYSNDPLFQDVQYPRLVWLSEYSNDVQTRVEYKLGNKSADILEEFIQPHVATNHVLHGAVTGHP